MTWLPLGLISWLIAGAATGALGWRLLPEPRRPSLLEHLLLAVAGAVSGGLLATALGFGGILGFEARALATAALGAAATVVWLRVARLPSPS